VLVGYARISTPEQRLDYQRDALISAGCVHVFSDVMSGKDNDRPGLNDALKLVKFGDTLVVWSLDRLARSLKDLVEVIETLEKKGAHLITLHEKIDTQSIAGKIAHSTGFRGGAPAPSPFP
jgi:Enterobacteriaceae phage serine recombinase